MPILWKYVIRSYLRIFCLSVFSFIAILLVSRFKEIARFAALSAEGAKIALFAAYQIPLILPIALPISALIASLLLFQRLSRTFELTALRTSGKSLFSLLAPVLFISFLLSLCNFSFCAEISPFCRRESKTLFYRETSANPLLLLQRQHLVKVKHAYLDIAVKEEGKAVEDFTLIAYNEGNERLTLISAKQLHISGDTLLGSDVAILSHLPSEEEQEPDSLVIENQTFMATSAPLLSTALKKNRPRLEPNALDLRMLQIRSREMGRQGEIASVEILRRFTLAFAVFSFTLLGAVFGIETGRASSKRGMLTALFFTLIVLISYLLAKELKHHFPLAAAALLFPHLALCLASAFQLRRINKGVGF